MENNRQPTAASNQTATDKPNESSTGCNEDRHPNSNTDKCTVQHKRQEPHPLEWAIGVLLFLTFLATSSAAVFTGMQWNTADDTEKRQTRAYVVLRDIRYEKINDTDFAIIPEWENSGNSETVGMTSRVSTYLSPAILPDGFWYSEMPGFADAPIILGPKTINNTTFSLTNVDCLKQFNRHDQVAKYYLWGHATYRDTLTTKQHVTRFCWDAHRVVFSADGNSARIFHGLCSGGNCADDQCPPVEKQILVLPLSFCKPEPVGSQKPPTPPAPTPPQ